MGEYERKRDLDHTPEPKGRRRKGTRRDRPIFVVQEHDARSRHFDLRLEVSGALKSWAVPKGPSTDPREKRLATPTEDHPLEYADFEDVIPEGQYGAGTVIVWDRGHYENLTVDDGGEQVDAAQAIERGRLTVRLHGQKLRGAYALTRMDGREEWLLIKKRDEDADARRNPVSSQPESVVSGRTIEDLAPPEGSG